ncbi:hypothetical protein N7449_011500 [Penicillium cf. viridicatum]|uniref:Uncharacterized protein n=1 Tax=Penicillium cf. viridicatum TaxID=2972119 RepID=A0A9W9J372_9EURO|nr:hypothetical protein N7449_011500 [Penicillium cf. viridicatum]
MGKLEKKRGEDEKGLAVGRKLPGALPGAIKHIPSTIPLGRPRLHGHNHNLTLQQCRYAWSREWMHNYPLKTRQAKSAYIARHATRHMYVMLSSNQKRSMECARTQWSMQNRWVRLSGVSPQGTCAKRNHLDVRVQCHCTFDILATHQCRRWIGRSAGYARFTSNTSILTDGKLDIPEAQAIAHCGYY